MKRALQFLAAALVVASVVLGLFWLFGSDQDQETGGGPDANSSPSAENEMAETLTKDEAIELAEQLVSQDEATYAAAWSHENIPSVSPEGTTIVVNTVESGDSVAVVDVTITTPETEPEEYYLLTQFVDDQWRVYTMEVK